MIDDHSGKTGGLTYASPGTRGAGPDSDHEEDGR